MQKRVGFLTKFDDVQKIASEIGKIKNVIAVYLFGSYARGKTHSLSDIDICVIMNKPNEKSMDKIISYDSDNLEISFFHMLPLAIRFRVFGEGKPLIVNDSSVVDVLKIATWKNYLDIKPLINLYCMERFGCTI